MGRAGKPVARKLPRPTPSRHSRSVREGGAFPREGFAGCRPAPMHRRGVDSAGRRGRRPAHPAIFNSRWTSTRHPGSEQGIFEASCTPRHSAWLRTVPPITRWERCASCVPVFGAGLRRPVRAASVVARTASVCWRGRSKNLPGGRLYGPPTRSSPPFRSDWRPTLNDGGSAL